MSDPFALDVRAGLPDGCRVLVEALPRLHWPGHPKFHGLASFWLERHLEFRRLNAALIGDARARLDGGLDPQEHARRLARLGNHLLGSLHGHHQIEDAEYFPTMARMDARVARGFELLEADHHALDGWLARFAESANGVLQGVPDAPGRFADLMEGFERMLDRHLEDEEEIVIPLILTSGM